MSTTVRVTNNTFKFKKFEVDQSGCAMRINTDGVLLAVMVESENPKNILDIGTGTGVIAMILTQRFEKANVQAVEIDEVASATAGRNFSKSMFADRLLIHHVSIEQFNTQEKFDLIVSNPPYFVNDLKNQEVKKGLARHTDRFFFDALVAKVDSLLSNNGSFWFVLPIKQCNLIVERAADFNLKVAKCIHLHSDATKP